MTAFIHTVPAWFELIFLAIYIGVLLCRLWVLDEKAVFMHPSEEKIRAHLWRLLFIGIAIMIACSVADLLTGTAEMSGSSLLAVFPLLPSVVLKTHFGRVWLIRMASLVLLSADVLTVKRHRDSRIFLYFLLIAGIIIAFTESASGHAADSGDFSIAEIMDWLHVLAASAWGGGLFVLSLSILPELIKADEGTARLIAGIAGRFSTLAGFAVGIIAGTALYNAWLFVGGFRALQATLYGWIVFTKTVLLFLLVLLGAFNRIISVPRLQEWAGTRPMRHGLADSMAVRLFSRSPEGKEGYGNAVLFKNVVKGEAFLMVFVLLCAALLRHEVPARHALHLEHAGGASSHTNHYGGEHMQYASRPESAMMRLETAPATIAAGIPVAILVHLEDQKGRPLQEFRAYHERVLHAVIVGQDLNIFAHIHPEDFAPLTDVMLDTATFPLRFTFPKAGTYLVGIDFATKDGVYSKTAKIIVSGHPRMGEPKIDFSGTKRFGHYQVALTTFPKRIHAGEETTLTYIIKKDGKPVTDLELYLGAAMHIAVVSADLARFIHTHGVVPGGRQDHEDHDLATPVAKFGPEIEASVIFPEKGVYRIFSQVEQKGKVLLFEFMVDVQ